MVNRDFSFVQGLFFGFKDFDEFVSIHHCSDLTVWAATLATQQHTARLVIHAHTLPTDISMWHMALNSL